MGSFRKNGSLKAYRGIPALVSAGRCGHLHIDDFRGLHRSTLSGRLQPLEFMERPVQTAFDGYLVA